MDLKSIYHRYRKHKKMTTKEVAKKLGVTSQALYQCLDRGCNYERFIEIFDALGYDVVIYDRDKRTTHALKP